MSEKKINAPLTLRLDTVRPEWIDYNQHMNEGYYGVAFCYTTDDFMDFVGLHEAYRIQSRCTIYTVETHISFLKELKIGSPLRITTHLLGFDTKRMHIFHEMYHDSKDYLAATMEAMLLHVNHEPRVLSMPGEILTQVKAIYTAHQALPWPKQAGRSIGLSKK